jgi:hypothetical protein
MKFTIRDLLWLTVVVALGVAWWLDRGRLAERLEQLLVRDDLKPQRSSWGLEEGDLLPHLDPIKDDAPGMVDQP